MKNKLKNKSSQELNELLIDHKKELIKLRAQVATGTTLKSPGQINKIKKNIARILTHQKNE